MANDEDNLDETDVVALSCSLRLTSVEDPDGTDEDYNVDTTTAATVNVHPVDQFRGRYEACQDGRH